MQHMLDQVRTAMSQHLYYPALFTALAVPDICGALGSKEGRSSRDTYMAWFDRYVAPQYGSEASRGLVTGADCYYFRCALLHQGKTQHPKSRFTTIIFAEPFSGDDYYTGNMSNQDASVLVIHLKLFCENVIVGAEHWLREAEGTEPYTTNAKRLARKLPNGLPPFVKHPVIASPL